MMKGTIEYIAPEMITENEYGFSVDFYSLGLVIYEMLSAGEHPFKKPDRATNPKLSKCSSKHGSFQPFLSFPFL